MKNSSDLKIQLYQFCVDYIEKRIRTSQDAIKSSQASANDESKSTAGDKHDTAKAMMHIEVEQYSKQLAEAQKIKEELSRVNISKVNSTVMLGSLVETNRGTYFISISAGKIEIEKKLYFAVSISSPFAQTIKGLKKGDKAKLHGSEIEILDLV